MTTTTKRIPANCATNPLERAALRWLNREGRNYADGAAGAAADLWKGGCSSGIVSELIYTTDTAKFARKHLDDILYAIGDHEQETCEPLRPDRDQSLGSNWLAWAGFELAARRVCDRAGIE